MLLFPHVHFNLCARMHSDGSTVDFVYIRVYVYSKTCLHDISLSMYKHIYESASIYLIIVCIDVNRKQIKIPSRIKH